MRFNLLLTGPVIGLLAGAVAAADDAPRLVPGKPAPPFTLKNQDDKDTSPADYKGKWLVVYFYPKDDTPG